MPNQLYSGVEQCYLAAIETVIRAEAVEHAALVRWATNRWGVNRARYLYIIAWYRAKGDRA